jgi:hypothetical protein
VIARPRSSSVIINGSWTTDRRRVLALREREASEAHADRMRERCPPIADLIKVEELEAAD